MTLPADLAEAIERARPRLGPLGSSTSFFSSIGSTNDVASSLAADGGHEGAVVIAETQTAGRGRRGRQWFSPPGSGLYVSVVLAPARARSAPARATSLITLAAGVALTEAIEHSVRRGLPSARILPSTLGDTPTLRGALSLVLASKFAAAFAA